MPATARKPKASRPRNNGSARQPSFLRIRRGELPYDIVGYMDGFDEGDSSEMSEWYDALIDDDDERGPWDLASEVLHQGYKLTVKVSAANAVRVAALIGSRLTEPIVAAYQSETETLAFWSKCSFSIMRQPW